MRILMIVALVSVLGRAAAADHAEHHKDHDARPNMSEHLKGDTGTAFDTHFLMMMVNHHKSAVEMASIAAEKATRPEVRDLATKTATEQRAEIASMETMLQAMGKQAAKPHRQFAEQAERDLAALRAASGDDFDREFLAMLAHHHQEAIETARVAQTNSQNADLKAMAAQMADAQAKDVTRMGQWHRQWFGKDLPPQPAAEAAAH